MFKATDFKLILRNCPEELDKLLQLLKISPQNFNDGNEFDIYDKLDKAIDKAFCAKLNCKSDLDGYAKLLDLGGIEFDLSETRNNMLKKILANRKKIWGQTTNHVKDFKLTCSYTEGAFDLKNKSLANKLKDALEKISAALKNKDISRLLPLEKEKTLNQDAEDEIKKVLAKHLDLSTCDEIVLSIIGKNPAPHYDFSASPVQKLDEDTFKILEQINRIFDKI